MNIDTLVVSPFEENCYLVWDTMTRRGVVIDPGDEGERIIRRIRQLGFTPEAILLTHGHADHIGAVAALKLEFAIPIYIGRREEGLLLDPRKNLSAFYGEEIVAPRADVLVDDSQLLEIAGFAFTVLAVPGHSPASVAYLCGDIIFSGDALFMGSIGRTDFPGSDYGTLMNSIATKLMALPDVTKVYSGHGPVTTIGRERKENPFLRGL